MPENRFRSAGAPGGGGVNGNVKVKGDRIQALDSNTDVLVRSVISL